MEQSSSSEANSHSASQEIPPSFMDPEGSLSYSQETATCPNPEPDDSNPHLHLLLFALTLYPLYFSVIRVVFSLQVFKPKYYMHFSCLLCMLNVPPVSYSLISSP